MKRSIVVAALLFVATGTFASESFTLNIPQRLNAQQETGKVLISLVLDSAPAGAQLVVNGAATLNLGDTQTIAGDSVKFEAGSGNEVRITYVPLSNFGADFCSGGGAMEKNIPLRFSGPQDVTEYRVSTYIVAAPDAECSQASKRTGDTPANLVLTGDGVAPALVATNRGRHEMDVVLVLDKSGSMNELPPDVVSGDTKVTILKAAMEAFVGNWKVLDAPTPGGADYSHDRLGVVMFDSTAHPQTLAGADPPANFFLQRGAGNAWNTVSSNIGTLTPGGSTSIGAGINEAMQQWASDPQHDLQLLVITDGKQNTDPQITTAPTGFLTLTPVATFPAELRERFVPIHTIGFGTPATVDADLLKNIGLETAGLSYVSVNMQAMYDDVAWLLVAQLKGNTASMALQQHGTMSGAGPSNPIAVPIDPSAQRAVINVQWPPSMRDVLDVDFFPPGASTPKAPSQIASTHSAAIQSYDLQPSDAGDWTLRVRRRHANSSASANADVPYTINVLFLERHLDYSFAFDKIHAGTGDSIRLRAVVAHDGKPLANLPAGAIRVRIQRPPDALGTILHDSTATGTVQPGADQKTPLQAKIDAITNASLLDRILPKDVATIPLPDEGHGVYSAVFDQTSVAGLYRFEAMLDWDDKRTGHVRRFERLEQEVKVKPDAASTRIETSRGADGTFLVRVTPRDKFGNYVGPGWESHLRATVNGGGALVSPTPADPSLTGTYTFTVTGATSPNVDITFDGVSLGTATPATPPASSSSANRFFLDLGPNWPHGGFANGVDGRWSLNLGIEHTMSPDWSLEAIAGYHLFDVQFVDHPHIWQASAGAKRYFGTSPLRPFVNASAGIYKFDPGNDTKGGASAGAGVLYQLSPKLAIEGVWNYHYISASGSGITFSTLQAGVRVGF